ncbi:MAG: hypothetical protein Q9157_005560 [Trypethelium eluteriae]
MAEIRRDGFTKLSGDSGGGANNDYRLKETWEGSPMKPKSGQSSAPNIFKSLFKHNRPSQSTQQRGQDGNSLSAKLFWPEELLPEDMPQARIWTYGYNADVINGLFQANNKNSVSQHGRDLAVRVEREIVNKDPIFFVAHSLGGIVALRRSKLCRMQTKLIVFLGTPHRGSGSVGWGEIAPNIAGMALQESNKDIVQTLAVNSEVLDNIHEEFTGIVQELRIKIHSFQEAQGVSGMKGLDRKVVDPFSSKLDLPLSIETVETIDANHMQMARCSGKTDPRYLAICGVLQRFVRIDLLNGNTQEMKLTHPTQMEAPSKAAAGPELEHHSSARAQGRTDGIVFSGPISGHNVISGMQTTGGTTNFTFN